MRFKLFRRRLTISAPRMAIRSHRPWIRWAGIAIMAGFYSAIALWTFEYGKSFAGLDSTAKEELVKLRQDTARLLLERDKAQSLLNTSGSQITTETSAKERLAVRIKGLEAENRSLRDDLGFYQKLIPATGTDGVAIRALQAEVLGGTQLKWQVMVIQPVKNAPEFRGKLQMSISGTLDGKPWMEDLPGGPQPLQFRQYRRVEGLADLPPLAVVQNVSVRVVEGTATRAVQSIKL
jgi:hypothetical protein